MTGRHKDIAAAVFTTLAILAWLALGVGIAMMVARDNDNAADTVTIGAFCALIYLAFTGCLLAMIMGALDFRAELIEKEEW